MLSALIFYERKETYETSFKNSISKSMVFTKTD